LPARPALKLLAYVVITGGLVAGLASGANFLLTPKLGGSQEAKATPVIPARIADSIERKKASVPQPEPVTLPEPPRPAMHEANVALTPAPPPKFRIRELSTPAKLSAPVNRKRQRKQEQTVVEAPAAPVRSAVTTARTDMPY
jgi:hypothetical protein